eukprot:1161097-Pelagomonas_calceolata.AAC.4
MYANKLVTTRRAIENNTTSHSQLCGGGDSRLLWANVDIWQRCTLHRHTHLKQCPHAALRHDRTSATHSPFSPTIITTLFSSLVAASAAAAAGISIRRLMLWLLLWALIAASAAVAAAAVLCAGGGAWGFWRGGIEL